MKPTAKSVILDLLSTLRRGTMPVGALIEAGKLFDIEANNTRVALARLMSDGRVARDERGRYRLGDRSKTFERIAHSWRNPDQRTRKWGGAWIGVLLGSLRNGEGRAGVRRRERALRFLGFRNLAPTLAVRPDNLRGGIEEVRAELTSLGFPPGGLVFEMRDLDSLTEVRARGLWDVAALRGRYRRLVSAMQRSARRLPGLPVEKAMVESFLLGGRAIRELVIDPLLPEEIFPSLERAALGEVLRSYDRLGRLAWVEFLERYDVPHVDAPTDTHLVPGRSSS